MKSVRKNDQGVSPVIAVILMVAITVVLAGVLYLWVSSLADTDEGAETMNVKASAYADLTAANDFDKIEIEIIGGTVTWAEYKVTVNSDVAAWTTASTSSSAGDTATFYDAAAGVATDADPGFAQGGSVTVKIINIGDNKVVWEKDIIAKGYSS